MSEYIKQAESFLEKTGSKLEIEYLKNDFHFEGDKSKRDIYRCTLSRGARSYTFNFGQSIADSQKGEKPTSYDILACLQTYPVYTFEDFCSEFGYDNDSIKALKVYEAVKDEYNNLCRLYTDQELELLSEIQ